MQPGATCPLGARLGWKHASVQHQRGAQTCASATPPSSSTRAMPPEQPAAPQPAGVGGIAVKCQELQGLLAKLSTESARSSAALLAGHDDCARLQEHTALLSKQFSRTAMQAVDEQREMLASSKSKMEAQHVALLAVGKQRDEAQAKAAELLSTLNSSTTQQSEEHAALVAAHSELSAKLESCLADFSAANAQIATLREQTEAMSASARDAAAAHKRELAARASLEENNVALAAELMQGEAAVVALHTQQLSVYESLAAERAALIQRNSELASKMAEDHTALERMRAEAATALEAVARENVELSARNAALSAEMEALAGSDAAGLAISLAEARAALTLAETRCKELAARNTSLSVQADAALAAAAEHRRLTDSNSQLANEAAMLQTRLAQISRGLDNVGTGSAADGPPSEADDASEVAFSDLASNISEAPGLTDAARAANKVRSAQNKAKFDAIKAERNAFKAEARKAAKELERMRAEVAKVDELKKQLSTLQESMFIS